MSFKQLTLPLCLKNFNIKDFRLKNIKNVSNNGNDLIPM